MQGRLNRSRLLTVSSGGHVSVGATLKLWEAGRLDLTGGAVTTGTLDNSAGGTVSFTAGELHVGTFIGDLVNDGGAVCPGGSAGLTTIHGDLTMNGGSVEIEVGGRDPGTGYDVLSVTGTARLGGTLDVTLIGSFVPMPRDEFEILTCGSRDGQFASASCLDGLAGFAGLDFELLYEPDGVTLEAVAVDGDANLDAKVDAFDLAVLANNYASSGKSWTEADFTGEGDVDVLGLLL